MRDVFIAAGRPLMGFFTTGLAYVQCHEQDDFAPALTHAGVRTTWSPTTPALGREG